MNSRFSMMNSIAVAVVLAAGLSGVARADDSSTNPFTGEPTVFKARPASKTAKVAALKKLKDSVGTKSR